MFPPAKLVWQKRPMCFVLSGPLEEASVIFKIGFFKTCLQAVFLNYATLFGSSCQRQRRRRKRRGDRKCTRHRYRSQRVFKLSAFSFTDLKKTLAVLLDNILQRIGKLESKVDNLVVNGTGTNATNSTTAVPSLVALEKINVAGKSGCCAPWRGIQPCSDLGKESRITVVLIGVNPINLVWPLWSWF